MALGVSSGFFNEEYLIAPVDFIAPCGGTKERGRRTLRSPPSPPSGLPPFQPGGSAAAGHVGCRGFGTILYAAFRCKSLIPSSEFGAAVCVRAGIARISEDFVGFWSLVFHYWWDGQFVPAAIVRFAVAFRRICANRGWVGCFGGYSYGKTRAFNSLNRTNALYNMVMPSQFGEMDLHQTKLKQ